MAQINDWNRSFRDYAGKFAEIESDCMTFGAIHTSVERAPLARIARAEKETPSGMPDGVY